MFLLSAKLRESRRKMEMTQEDVAGALGVAPQTVSKWERAETYPDITLLPGIANYFGVTVDELIGNDEIGQEEDIKQFYDKSNEMDDTEIELVGLCTDICVVSNALILKANYPDTDIYVDSSCCAGVTPEKHQAALETMRSCQIIVRGE